MKSNSTKMVNGLHIQYSNVNAAWFLMWFDQVLSIHNERWEAQATMDDLLLNDSGDRPKKANK